MKKTPPGIRLSRVVSIGRPCAAAPDRWRMKWLALVFLSLTACHEPTRVPLAVEAYVWQSPARPEVREAMTRAAGHITTLHIRAAELRWTGERFAIEKTLTTLPSPGCGLVIRIGASASRLEWTPGQIKEAAAVFSELAALRPKEIQCDFDCPQKRLGRYIVLLDALQSAAGGIPVLPTALPTWLDEPDFAKLVAGRGGYVLQVHSLQLPKQAGEPVMIFDPAAARTAAKKASDLKEPFRIAMATYGCEVRFGTDGKVIDVVSEDAGTGPASARAFALADPLESARLVQEWQRDPPAGLTGIVWYRLPVAGDRRNWPWETFERVIRGEVDPSKPDLEISPGAGAKDLFVVNRGTFPVLLPGKIVIGHPVPAADGAGAYRLEQQDGVVHFIRRNDVWPWLDPGKKIPTGWLRFREEPARIQWSFQP